MRRGQFTFYRSYYEALKSLPPEYREPTFMAICGYALDEEAPELAGVPGSVFTLVKPTLDSGRRKAESGRSGGDAKQAGSRSKANGKQTGSKREAKRKQTGSEKEKEGEREKENECSPPTAPQGAFERFWSAYPKKVGKAAAKKAFGRVKVPVETLLSAISRQKCSDQWSRDNGQYIPNPATWLNQGRWEDEPCGDCGAAGRDDVAWMAKYIKGRET